jgi:phosphinothricin acetyltransferase
VIRHGDPNRDAAACAAIYAPSVREAATSFEERVPSVQEMADRIERYSRSHAWLVAADAAGGVIGFAYGCPHRDRAAYRWAADVSAYIAAGHRRRGIGRALYGALLPLLRRRGIHVACAGITLPNDASVALHESSGFVPVGVYRKIGFKAGAWRDVGWWQAELIPHSEGPPPEPGPPARLPSSDG